MTSNNLTLAEAAKELSRQLERLITERQILAYGKNNQISIFATISGNARFVRIEPVEGEQNEFQAVNGALLRLSSNAVTSLLLTGRAQYIEHTNIESVNYLGRDAKMLEVKYKIADGEIPPETTIADCRISQASIEIIMNHEDLVANLEWEGKTTDYDWWLNLDDLKPHEAIMLLNFCHPEKPLNTFSSKTDPAKHAIYEKIKKELMQAERAQTAGKVPVSASPLDWYNWAKENNYNIPTQFNAILCAPQIESIQATNDSVDTRKKWEILGRLEFTCRTYGNEFIEAQKKLNKRQPSVEKIAKHIENRLKDENITAPRGDYWDWQTVKREALTGITGKKAKGK